MVLAALAIYIMVSLALYLGQESFIFQGVKIPAEAAFSFPGVDFEEVFLETEDGIKLNGLHFKAKDPQGIVVYFHGNAGNIAGYGQVSPDFTRKGWDLFMIDYRGYGKTPGSISETKLFLDGERAWQYCASQFPSEQIIIYGRSLGSSVACHVAATHPEARQLILETPFFSLRKMAASTFWMLPIPLLLKYPLRNDKRAPNIKMPVTIFHGTADEVVPYKQGKSLKPLFAGPAELITIKGGHHNDLREYPEYQLGLQKALESPPTSNNPVP